MSASSASAQASPGGIGVRLLTDPSVSSADPLTLSYLVERLAPGSFVLRRVEVSNTTDTTVDIFVYAAAASFSNGAFTFAPGRAADALSSWTTVTRSVLRLAPRTSAIDEVTISVPKHAAAGERYAVVWAQVSAALAPHSGIRLVNRVGIRMYISVGQGGSPAAKFTVGVLVAGLATDGDPRIVSKVHNVGLGAIEVTGTLKLSNGPGGSSAGPFPVTLGRLIAPGHSEFALVELSQQFPRGKWRADLAVSSGGTRRSTASTIEFASRILASGERSLVIPLLLSFLITLVLIVGVGNSALVLRRRRRRLERLDGPR